MLFQKNGLRMKQFITHRRSTSVEEYGGSMQGSYPDKKPSDLTMQTSDSQRLSWASHNSCAKINPLQKASSSITTRIRPSPPIQSTTHSSASSLCSCECTSNPPPSGTSLSSLPPPRIEPRSEILYLPSVSPTSSGDAKTWRLIFPEQLPCSSPDAICDSGKTRSSTFNLFEALMIDPAESDRTPTQSIRNSDEQDMDSIEDNVEQLIRETDEAFNAVGTALADAKAATQGWRKDILPELVAGDVSISRENTRKEARASGVTPKSSIVRTQPVAKGNMKGLHKKKNLLGRVWNAPPHHASAHPRWTLTDVTASMVDIFSGIKFKIEADEMLTPDKLRRLQQEKMEKDRRAQQGEKVEVECRLSVESTRSVETDGSTPTEPFHLESLSSRLAAADVPSPSPALLPPTILQVQRRRSPARKGLRAVKAKVTLNNSEVELEELKLPSPPQFLTRPNFRSTPPLPTIPEVPPLSFKAPQPRYGRCRARQFSFESIEPPLDYIFLPSTSFTLTSPLFKQGPIRIVRREKELLPDEVLDWTAFQMAISGPIDESGVDKRDDIEKVADETEADEVLEWWAGYKFPGYSQMTKEGPSKKQKNAETGAIKTHGNHGSKSGTDKIVVEGTMQGGTLRWSYAESLPPSPMLEFVPPSPTKKEEVIPMGFNLSHDLGDFLDWETNYVRKYYGND